jgi:hypothetical protein
MDAGLESSRHRLGLHRQLRQGSWRILAIGWAASSVTLGQSNEWLALETGGAVLRTLEIPTVSLGNGRFEFQVGFETDEIPGPSFLADSFTISLTGAEPDQVITLATLDIFGLSLAPSNPGGRFLPLDSIRMNQLPLIAPPMFSNAVSYRLTVDVPETLQWRHQTVALDLFDNQNGVGSRGLIGRSAEAIPEPATLPLIGCAGAMLALLRRWRKLW